MSDLPNCPKCDSEFTYNDGVMFVCPECSHEWNENSISDLMEEVVKDANGNALANGDSIALIKDLKVKGGGVIKQGTVAKNIMLVNEAGHNISCKVTGAGNMLLKSEFVKKV